MDDMRKIMGTVEPLFEMAGLRHQRTGLPVYVWVSPRAGSRHDVRIKVSPTNRYQPEEEAIIGLRPEFTVLHGELTNRNIERLLRQWVVLNFDTLIAFWDEEIDQDEMFERIVAI